MTKDTVSVEITRADRDAADAVFDDFLAALQGKEGGGVLPEAFARHRIEATRKAEAERDEALGVIIDLLDGCGLAETQARDLLTRHGRQA